MRTPFILALSTLVVAGVSGCAPSTGPMEGQTPTARSGFCFDPARVTNFRTDTDALYVRALGGAVYELNAVSACLDLDGANAIVLTPAFGTSSRLCVGDTAIAASALRSGDPCRVRVNKALTAEELEALPSRLRP